MAKLTVAFRDFASLTNVRTLCEGGEHYHVYEGPLPVRILSQQNPVHILRTY
jgi:hypothetical protein